MVLATLPRPRRPLAQVEPETYLGPRGQHRELVNRDGLRLQTYFWPAAAPRAVLLFCHGHGAHLHFEVLKAQVGAAGRQGGRGRGQAGGRRCCVQQSAGAVRPTSVLRCHGLPMRPPLLTTGPRPHRPSRSRARARRSCTLGPGRSCGTTPASRSAAWTCRAAAAPRASAACASSASSLRWVGGWVGDVAAGAGAGHTSYRCCPQVGGTMRGAARLHAAWPSTLPPPPPTTRTALQDYVEDVLQLARCVQGRAGACGGVPAVQRDPTGAPAVGPLAHLSPPHSTPSLPPACREVQAGGPGIPGFEPGLPRFVGGISLGGCIALHAALADRAASSQLFR